MRTSSTYRNVRRFGLAVLAIGFLLWGVAVPAAEVLSLAGNWDFRRDDQKSGEKAQWFASPLGGGQTIKLPGTMEEAKLGIPNPQPPSLVGLYRPNTYEGMAWYQRQVEIPDAWRGKRIELFLEYACVGFREHGSTASRSAGHKTASLPHIYSTWARRSLPAATSLRSASTTRRRSISALLLVLYGGVDGNLNGVIGKIELRATDPVWIDDVEVYPNIEKRTVRVKARIGNVGGETGSEHSTATVRSVGGDRRAGPAGESQQEIRWPQTARRPSSRFPWPGKLSYGTSSRRISTG